MQKTNKVTKMDDLVETSLKIEENTVPGDVFENPTKSYTVPGELCHDIW